MVLGAAIPRVSAGRVGEGAPLTPTIPWDCVVGFRVIDDERMLIRIKHMKPKGVLRFQPVDVDPVLAALR